MPQTQILLLVSYLVQNSVFSTEKCLLDLQHTLILEKGLFLFIVIYLVTGSFLELPVVLA